MNLNSLKRIHLYDDESHVRVMRSDMKESELANMSKFEWKIL